MNMIQIPIVNKSRHALPEYATEQSSVIVFFVIIDAPVTLEPLQRALISSCLFFLLRIFYEAQVRPRSGLAIKHGVGVLNAPGTIDADYRGEIKVILVNLSAEPFTINDGDRIAQMVIARHETIAWQPATELSETERGAGGFGHSGV